MKVAFYSVLLNHHQAPVADEFYELLGDDYHFISMTPSSPSELKGGEDYSCRPYCIRAYAGQSEYNYAMNIALTADVCVFDGNEVLPFFEARARLKKLSFDVSERWLKRGILNMLSPRLLKHYWSYLFKLRRAPTYKLCASAFVSQDDNLIGLYRGQHYKWGYFTKVNGKPLLLEPDECNFVRIMWCARFIPWKHPELPIFVAKILKNKGYRFLIDMYGEGRLEAKAKGYVKNLGLEDIVNIKGTLPNDNLMIEMQQHSIFLFTSDRNEGWGAVSNESMANGCVLIGSNVIGSVPYLIQDGTNGLIFRGPSRKSDFENPDKNSLKDLADKLIWLFENKEKAREMQRNAIMTMQNVWSPKQAAANFIRLVSDLQTGNDSSIISGPCSKA